MYKMHNKMIPEYVCEMFTPEIIPYSVRFTSKYVLPPFRTILNGKKSISFLGVKIWNNLDNDIRESENIQIFNRKL